MSGLFTLTWTFLWLSLLCVGGGLGVVPEMERQAVSLHAWMTARQFVDGYTLSQLTIGVARLPWSPRMLRWLYGALLGTALVYAGVGLYQWWTREVFWK